MQQQQGPGGVEALDEDPGEVVTITIKVAQMSMKLSLRYDQRAMPKS